jgi:hypothetical protein
MVLLLVYVDLLRCEIRCNKLGHASDVVVYEKYVIAVLTRKKEKCGSFPNGMIIRRSAAQSESKNVALEQFAAHSNVLINESIDSECVLSGDPLSVASLVFCVTAFGCLLYAAGVFQAALITFDPSYCAAWSQSSTSAIRRSKYSEDNPSTERRSKHDEDNAHVDISKEFVWLDELPIEGPSVGRGSVGLGGRLGFAGQCVDVDGRWFAHSVAAQVSPFGKVVQFVLGHSSKTCTSYC